MGKSPQVMDGKKYTSACKPSRPKNIRKKPKPMHVSKLLPGLGKRSVKGPVPKCEQFRAWVE